MPLGVLSCLADTSSKIIAAPVVVAVAVAAAAGVVDEVHQVARVCERQQCGRHLLRGEAARLASRSARAQGERCDERRHERAVDMDDESVGLCIHLRQAASHANVPRHGWVDSRATWAARAHLGGYGWPFDMREWTNNEPA